MLRFPSAQMTILKGFDLTWWVGKSDIRLELRQLDAKWCDDVHRVWYSLLTCLLVCLFACLLVYSTAETEEYQTLAPICVATEMPFQMFIMFWPTNTPQKNATQMLQPDYFHRFWANDVTFSSDFWRFFKVFHSWNFRWNLWHPSLSKDLFTWLEQLCCHFRHQYYRVHHHLSIVALLHCRSSPAYSMFPAEEHKWSVNVLIHKNNKKRQ